MTTRASTKLIAIIILGAIPAVGAGLTMLLDQKEVFIFSLPPDGVPIVIYVLDIIGISVSTAFGLYPILNNNIQKFREYVKLKTEEYRLVKKILSIEIPILILLLIFYYLTSFVQADLIQNFTLTPDTSLSWIANYLINLDYFLLYAVTGGLLWIASSHINKEFNFWLAKGSLDSITEGNEFSKVECFKNGLKYYNRFLERVIKLQINDIDAIISMILSDSRVDKDNTIRSITRAFESSEKLGPVSAIATALNIKEPQKFLVKERLEQKVKSVGTYVIASIVPAIVSLIQLLLPQPS